MQSLLQQFSQNVSRQKTLFDDALDERFLANGINDIEYNAIQHDIKYITATITDDKYCVTQNDRAVEAVHYAVATYARSGNLEAF